MAKVWKCVGLSEVLVTLRDGRLKPQSGIRYPIRAALIATLTYSFARINAALKMKVEDLRPQGAGWRLRLHEKGGKHHAMPCHHALAEALHVSILPLPASPRTARAFCSEPAAGTTPPCYPSSRWINPTPGA